MKSTEKVAGRLQHHYENWKFITKDRWVLDTIKGYCMDFASEPRQLKWPTLPTFNQDQLMLIQQEVVEKLINKGQSQIYQSLRPGFTQTCPHMLI